MGLYNLSGDCKQSEKSSCRIGGHGYKIISGEVLALVGVYVCDRPAESMSISIERRTDARWRSVWFDGRRLPRGGLCHARDLTVAACPTESV